MEEVKKDHGSISRDVTNLVETYLDLAKVTVTQKAANAASVSVTGILAIILAFFCIQFAGIALAWWIGGLINSLIGGFLIVAGLFGLLLILLIAFREKLLYPMIRDGVVRKVYE